ncbi:MAG TPA: hypothetical protein VF881_18285 [Polyangiaceae bacterium]
MSFSVLVVEDHLELRQAIEELLVGAGYLVWCACDSDEALKVLSAMPRPCLVLWDPLTHRVSLSLVAQAAVRGVHVATIPIGITRLGHDEGSPRVIKRLTSEDALMSIVKEHCGEAS